MTRAFSVFRPHRVRPSLAGVKWKQERILKHVLCVVDVGIFDRVVYVDTMLGPRFGGTSASHKPCDDPFGAHLETSAIPSGGALTGDCSPFRVGMRS